MGSGLRGWCLLPRLLSQLLSYSKAVVALTETNRCSNLLHPGLLKTPESNNAVERMLFLACDVWSDLSGTTH